MRIQLLLVSVVMLIMTASFPGHCQEDAGESPMATTIELPTPNVAGDMSLEEALSLRRSRRDLAQGTITLDQLSQIAWAAQGITAKERYRTAPSAGALYPLEVYFVVMDVEGLKQGLYHYSPHKHTLMLRQSGSLAKKVAGAALGQEALKQAAVITVISAVAEVRRSFGSLCGGRSWGGVPEYLSSGRKSWVSDRLNGSIL